AFAPIWLRSTGPPGAGPGRWVDRAMRTPLHRSQTGHVPGARLAEQAGIARISNASNLDSRFRYPTRLVGLDWIMSASGFAFSALIASRRTRLVRGGMPRSPALVLACVSCR